MCLFGCDFTVVEECWVGVRIALKPPFIGTVLMVHRHGSQIIINHQLMKNIIIKKGITNNNFLCIVWYKNPKFNNTSASSSSPIGPVTSSSSLGESPLLHPMPMLMLCKAHAPELYWNSGYPCPRALPCTKNQLWCISWYNLKLWKTITYKVCFEISQSSEPWVVFLIPLGSPLVSNNSFIIFTSMVQGLLNFEHFFHCKFSKINNQIFSRKLEYIV